MTDRSCPYYQHCHQSGECDDCDYHLKFEYFKDKIRRLENKVSKQEALLQVYRGIEGSRMHELVDAEIQGRIVVLPCTLTTPIYLVTSSKVNRRMVEKVEKASIDHFTIGESKIPVITACTEENEWYESIDGTKESEEFFLSEKAAIRSLKEK